MDKEDIYKLVARGLMVIGGVTVGNKIVDVCNQKIKQYKMEKHLKEVVKQAREDVMGDREA